MAIRKPAIPAVNSQNTMGVLNALKENIEIITGARTGEIQQLTSTATTAQIIEKINQIVVKLNASGK